MRFNNLPNWPPAFLTSDCRQTIIDACGILRSVTPDTKAANRCSLIVEVEGTHYVSWVKFDNAAFRARFMEKVSGHLNERVKEIGDLEIAN